MSKYVKGKYKAVANEDSFHSLINLKHKIQWVAGLEQNNMIVTHSDLKAVDNSISEKYKTNILQKGGTIEPMKLYKKFRGKEPDPKALLKRAGLI
jgi:hypothetical protein